ncbi:MAG TPA: histidine kinase [Bacteroidales bacterium]|nr:histidine kinase [Bacteroidales bacterium]
MQKKANNNIIRIILHILAWLLVLGLPYYSTKRYQLGNDFLLIPYTFIVINGLIFYTNYLFLVPGLFFQKKRYRYYFAVVALVFCFYFISDFSNEQVISYISKNANPDQQRRLPGENQRPGPPMIQMWRPRIPIPRAHLIGYTSSSLFMIFLSLGLRVLERQSKIEKMQEEMEKAKLNAELAFLKNQISPHFFFNTLNNIYSLIGINQEDSQKAVLKLSKLMRYLLYESEQGNVRLSSEIDFMKNYIDLMKLRMNERVSLNVDFPGKYDDVDIPPLLFIPFIENAFKHGITNRGISFINIGLVSSGRLLEFKCKNSNANGPVEEKQPGIGLDNVTKRLKLLFPEKHELRISRDNESFSVHLIIRFA